MTKVPFSQLDSDSDLDLKDRKILGADVLEITQKDSSGVDQKRVKFTLTSGGAIQVEYFTDNTSTVQTTTNLLDATTGKLNEAAFPTSLNVAKGFTAPDTVGDTYLKATINTVGATPTYTWVALNSTLPSNPSGGAKHYLTITSGNTAWETTLPTGLQSVEGDTTPVLGGSLEIGDKTIKRTAYTTEIGINDSGRLAVNPQSTLTTYSFPTSRATVGTDLLCGGLNGISFWKDISAVMLSGLDAISVGRGVGKVLAMTGTNGSYAWVTLSGGGSVTYNGNVVSNIALSGALSGAYNSGTLTINGTGGGGSNDITVGAGGGTGYKATLAGTGSNATNNQVGAEVNLQNTTQNDPSDLVKKVVGFKFNDGGVNTKHSRGYQAFLQSGEGARGYQAIFQNNNGGSLSYPIIGFNAVSLDTAGNTLNVGTSVGSDRLSYMSFFSGVSGYNISHFVSDMQETGTRIFQNVTGFLARMKSSSALNYGFEAEVFAGSSNGLVPFIGRTPSGWGGTVYRAIQSGAAGGTGYYSENLDVGFSASVFTNKVGFNALAVTNNSGTGFIGGSFETNFLASSGVKGFRALGVNGEAFIANNCETGLYISNDVNHSLILEPNVEVSLPTTGVANGEFRVRDNGGVQDAWIRLEGVWKKIAFV